MKSILKPMVLTAIALSGAHAFAQGPGSTYYLTSGSSLWAVQGVGDSSVSTVSGNEYNLAVNGDIRTTQERTTDLGYQYGLNGVPTGATYAGSWLGFFDGTTDGTNNYSVDWDTGDVYSFDRNWQNGNIMFNVGGGSGQYLGITYDNAGGLWLSQWGGTRIEHYSMNGTLLGGFDAGVNSISALAMDYSTGTLWFGSQPQLGMFWNYSTNGSLLGSQMYTDLNADNTLGGEFDLAASPEPASMAALLGGVLLLARRRRR